jgi:hypothetical protein
MGPSVCEKDLALACHCYRMNDAGKETTTALDGG